MLELSGWLPARSIPYLWLRFTSDGPILHVYAQRSEIHAPFKIIAMGLNSSRSTLGCLAYDYSTFSGNCWPDSHKPRL
jgi:hypothetical protein